MHINLFIISSIISLFALNCLLSVVLLFLSAVSLSALKGALNKMHYYYCYYYYYYYFILLSD